VRAVVLHILNSEPQVSAFDIQWEKEIQATI